MAVMILSNAFSASDNTPATDIATNLWCVRRTSSCDNSEAFYRHAIGWTDEDSADQFSIESLATSKLMDVLASITDENNMSGALTIFCKETGLEVRCVTELLYEQTKLSVPNASNIAWLVQFNRQWKALMDAAA